MQSLPTRLIVSIVSFLCFFSQCEAELIYVVAGGGAQALQVIDTSTNTLVATIPIAGALEAGTIVFNSEGTIGYVNLARSAGNEVLVLDVATSSVIATIPLQATDSTLGNAAEALTPNGKFLYVSNTQSGPVNVINTETKAVIATIPVSQPFGIVATLDGNFVYVANQTPPGAVNIISTSSNTIVATISNFPDPAQLALSPNGDFILVTDENSEVFKISTSTQTVTATISLLSGVFGIAINPSGTQAYVSSSNQVGGNTANIIDLETNSVIATINTSPLGASTYLATTSDGKFVYLSANASPPSVYVIDPATNTQVDTVAGTNDTFGLAVLPSPPSSSTGVQIANYFLTQTDLVNVITWGPPTGFIPVTYQIFRDASLTILAGTVGANVFAFEDHNRIKKKIYSYFIVAVNAAGASRLIGNVTVVP